MSLEDEIRRIFREELARAPEGPWSSRSLPPDVRTPRRFNEVCRGIVGATKLGRVWTVPRADWEVHRRKRRATPVPDDVDAIISAAGYRPTRAA